MVEEPAGAQEESLQHEEGPALDQGGEVSQHRGGGDQARIEVEECPKKEVMEMPSGV